MKSETVTAKAKSERGDHSLDEGFKALLKHLLEPYGHVITDYELIISSKRVDAVIIKVDRPGESPLNIFDYFKRFNIIEFKSEKDGFRIERHLPNLLIYLGGVILSEKSANFENTTFTLICSKRPEKLLKMFKKSTQKIKKGIYLVQGVFPIPLHLIVPDEIEGKGELDEELAFLKEFATSEEREGYLREILKKVVDGDKRYGRYLSYGFSLYKEELAELARKEGLDMMMIERNTLELVDELNLREKIIKEGVIQAKMDDARRMLERGLELDFVIEITQLPRELVAGIKV